MNWPITFIGTFIHFPTLDDLADLPSRGQPAGEARQVWPGECFHHIGMLTEDDRVGLSKQYLAIASQRPPLFIFTPGGWWCPDQLAWNVKQRWHGPGWSIRGNFPRITITPSILFPDRYHGWVTDGALSNDIDGRRFAESGKRLP
jgi:hypothetical protein